MAESLSSDHARTYLGVLDLLIAHWGESYGHAYLSQIKMQGPN